jgi:hypothetical protein
MECAKNFAHLYNRFSGLFIDKNQVCIVWVADMALFLATIWN